MPEVRCARTVDRPLPQIWGFVQDFDNWAPMLRGYMKHEVESDTDSIWTLKGEAGALSRTVNLRVHITEYGEERVSFELTGLDEAVNGGGSFDFRPVGEAPLPPPRTWWQKIMDWFTGRKPALPGPPGSAQITFDFKIEAQGPMGPMVNAMLAPWTEQVAEELLESIATKLEAQEAA
ncbi:MAG: SRPBCC family protein [Proteobacteria bacterium]|nr:SRPBCC family protein [Pseudomonadota bacterium]MCP4922093.1 SRPBCC family protein [Pseudomonadota bacterium]